MTFEEFKQTEIFAKMSAVGRLTGKPQAELDLYLYYILKRNLKFSITHIKQLLKDGEVSNILEGSSKRIYFKNYDAALKCPEYSIFVTSMAGLFEGYPYQSLDLSKFNTSNVKDMKRMFFDCESLVTLDLSNFDTSKVKDMCEMFKGCKSLTNFTTKNFVIMDEFRKGGEV